MEIKESDELKELFLPLGLYEAVKIANAINGDGKKFNLYAGLSNDNVQKLKELSLDERDEAVQNFTSDRKRFGEGSYEKWYSNNRTPFVLVDAENDALAALVWFGPKPLGEKSMKHLTKEEQEEILKKDPGGEVTLAYRSYSPYRGIGVMKDFLIFTMDLYLKQYPNALMWGIIDKENPASFGLAKAIGFEELKESDRKKSGHVVMVKK